MKQESILFQYDKDTRIRRMHPEARREITGDVVRYIRPTPGMNVVSFTFANQANLDRVIVEQLDFFTPLNQPLTWKVYDHDRLPKLEGKLSAQNFAGDDDPASVMVFDMRNTPSRAVNLRGIDIRPINERKGLKDIVHVLDKVYGGKNDWVYGRMGMHLEIPQYLSVYAAYVDDEPASIAWTYFPHGQFAGLFGGTTLAEHRGRGLYTSLLHKRLEDIRQRGYAYAVVEAGPMSKSIVARHGFQHLTTVYDYEWQGR